MRPGPAAARSAFPASTPSADLSTQGVPLITLPREWALASDASISALRGGDGAQFSCVHCHWGGDYGELLDIDPALFAKNPVSDNCVCCRLMSLVLRNSTIRLTGDSRFNSFDNINSTTGVFDAILTRRLSSDHQLSSLRLWSRIFLLPSASDVASGNIPQGIPIGRELPNNSGNADSIAWGVAQVEQCVSSHEECRQFQTCDFLPTRLICINPAALEGADVILRNGSDLPKGSRYVALSYCWGGYEPECKTTIHTLEEHKKRIPWSSLPQTFQEAVEVTRALGVDYLWIDSVCIIQGDEDEWNREAGKMFHGYKNAYVTLAAVWGNSSQSGLFSESTNWDAHALAKIKLADHTWDVYVRNAHPEFHDWDHGGLHSVWGIMSTPTPLFSRAWAYQERLITPRILYFFDGEIAFQCFSMASCVCGCTDEETLRYRWRNSKLDFQSMLDIQRRGLQAPNQESQQEVSPGIKDTDKFDKIIRWGESPREAWYEVVSGYCTLELTHESDRLSAISAVAETFQSIRPNEQYLAGLWSGSILEDLLWKYNDGKSVDTILYSEERLGSYRAHRGPITPASPSWSWAFANASKLMFAHQGFYQIGDSVANHVAPAEVVRVTCEYVDGNPYGTLTSSSLVLRGRLLACWAVHLPLSRGKAKLYHWRSGRVTDIAFSDLDSPGDFRTPQTLHLLDMGKLATPRTERSCCLILRAGAQKGTFYRIGFLQRDAIDAVVRLQQAFDSFGKRRECTII